MCVGELEIGQSSNQANVISKLVEARAAGTQARYVP